MKTGKNAGKVLGELETQVMEIIWRSTEPLSVADVLKVLGRKRPIAYTTVQTIMTRLVEKGVLTRKFDDSSYLYQSKVSRENFVAKSVHTIFATTVSALGQEAVTYFVKEIKKLSPSKRQELLKILDE